MNAPFKFDPVLQVIIEQRDRAIAERDEARADVARLVAHEKQIISDIRRLLAVTRGETSRTAERRTK